LVEPRDVDDRAILAHAEGMDAIGIDAPFGWPGAFVQHVRDHHEGRGPDHSVWTTDLRDRLRFRRTDHFVRAALGRWPLSVSTDLIALPALRCTGLLRRLGVEDRSGDGRVFEVYPAAALHQWGLPSVGYKRGPDRHQLLESLVAQFQALAPWLDFPGNTLDLISSTDDAFDAMISALAARAAFLSLTTPPPPDDAEAATREGWIAVPERGCLDRLLGG
jgi:hypothetical protein